ncbi:MAG: hypothetical protein P0Y59_10660 [Candidatus Sphingomonas phytovorans]|nr:hypothetical protein [Sphingomonas sp.]WEK02111.1 MAG: hypothetical protein P0Y59_10660 [Sphingomonas sp.]
MLRPRRHAAAWWEPMLPAGVWLFVAGLVLGAARLLLRFGGKRHRPMILAMRLSGRLSRAGFNSWRYWEGRW